MKPEVAGFQLRCQELVTRDNVTASDLLGGNFSDVAAWLTERYQSQLHRWILETGNPPQSVAAQNLQFFYSSSASKLVEIHQSAAVSDTIRDTFIVIWRPAIRRPPRAETDTAPLDGIFVDHPAYLDSIIGTIPTEYITTFISFVAGATLSGVIGNRADAVVVKAYKSLVEQSSRLWRRRHEGRESSEPRGLTEEELLYVERAVVQTLSSVGGQDAIHISSRQRFPDGSWLLKLARQVGGREVAKFEAHVPTGDPRDTDIRLVGYEAERRRPSGPSSFPGYL